MEKNYKYSSSHGFNLDVTIGKFAEQANGECYIRSGDTSLLVTAVASEKPREGIDFFPLICDFQEKLYAVGKIPGGFLKREGKASDEATLISRQMDRPLRPLFPENYYNDVQVIATVLSMDEDNLPDCLSTIGASIALLPLAPSVDATVIWPLSSVSIVTPVSSMILLIVFPPEPITSRTFSGSMSMVNNLGAYSDMSALGAFMVFSIKSRICILASLAFASEIINDDVIEKIRAIDSLIDIEKKDEFYHLSFTHGKDNLIKLINILNENSINYDSLSSESPSLNDVFLSLTGKELRD